MQRKYLRKLNNSIKQANQAKLVLEKVKLKRKGIEYNYDYTAARANYDWALNKINIYKELMIDLGSDPEYINSITGHKD
jgi:hypothetical protein